MPNLCPIANLKQHDEETKYCKMINKAFANEDWIFRSMKTAQVKAKKGQAKDASSGAASQAGLFTANYVKGFE